MVGGLETGPCRGIMDTPPALGDIPIGPARAFGDMQTVPFAGEANNPPCTGEVQTVP
jgi:hypothetical protein